MRSGLLVVVAVFVAGCSNDEVNPPVEGVNASEVIARMELEGAALVLDRSDSLKGEDANNNGIRDDVEAFIEGVPVSEKQKEGLRGYAKGMQRIQTSEEMTPEVALSITNSYIPDYFCMTTFSKNGDDLRRISKELSALTANTPGRAGRYLNYNSSMNGVAINVPPPARCQEGGW